VLFVALYLPGNALALALGSIDRGDQNFFRYNLVRVGPQSIYLAGVLLLWMTGQLAVMPLAYSILAGTWMTAAVRAVTLRGRVAWELSEDRIKQLFRSGLTFHAGNLSETFFGRADRFVLATWFSDAQFGFYAAALTLGGAGIGKVSGATNAILLPKLASAVTRDERKRTLRNALTANLAVAGMLNLIVAASAPLMVPWLFGAEFAPAAPLAVVVCLAEIPASYCRVASLGLRAMDDWSTGLSSQGLGFVVFAGVAILGSASSLGVLGVALATLAAQTAAMAYLIRRIRQRLGLSAWECLLPPVGLLHSLSRRTIEAVRRQPAS
jgi:O-antigen/teichoic acid export membrane protein